MSFISNNRYKKSKQLLRRAKFCDAWAATYVKNYTFIEEQYPVYCSHALGAYLWDVDNNRYIDYLLGYGTVVLGHAHPKIINKVIKELKTGSCVAPLWKPIQVRLTKLLVSIIPKAEMAFLMKTGSDATSGAVRLARIHTRRDKVVRWGYNGWHDWATPRPKGVPSSTRSDVFDFTYNDPDSLQRLFIKYPDQIACVLMMPFENEIPYPGFLHDIRNIAHENGALFILDEMRSGFRFALGGAQEYFGIQADLATYSKAMSNGYPISAIVGKKNILQGMEQTKMTATYFGTSIEMVAALATISILKNTNAINHIWKMGKIFQEGLKNLVAELEIPAEVVGYAPYPYIRFTSLNDAIREKIKKVFYSEAARLGIFFHPNHHWYICSEHTQADIEYTLDVCKKCFQAVRYLLKDTSFKE